MTRQKFKIRKLEALYFVVISVYLSPGYLQTINIYHRGWQAVCVAFSLYYIAKLLRKPRYLHGFALILAFYSIVLFSTALNHGLILQFLILTIIGVGFVAFIITTLSSNEKRMYALNAMIASLEVYVVLNLITIVVFPEGLYRIYGYNLDWASNPAYLLGHRNNAIEYFLPLIGLVGLKNRLRNIFISYNFVFVIAISAVTSLLTWSVNAILCLSFLFVSLIIYRRKGIMGYTIPILLGASALASFVLVNIEVNPFVQNIIVNVLHKSTNMSGRTRIWGRALLSIRDSFIYGHGIQDNYYNYTRLTTVGSCHNYFLDFLYWGGIICLIIAIAYFLYIHWLYKKADKKIENYFNVFNGTYFILWIATPIHKENMFLMFGYFMATAILAIYSKQSVPEASITR